MKNLLAIAACIIFVVIVIGLLPVHGEAEIYDSVVRLHVLANSDSAEDQELKLKVRDSVLSASGDILEGCETREAAIAAISSNLESLEKIAEQTVREAGYDYGVRVELVEEGYPTKNYEAFCFPAGDYLSLRVLIGDAEGQNWWCVLFPPLCLSAATDKSSAEDAVIAVGLTSEQYKVITETDDTTYEVRFKILETFEDAKNSLGGIFSGE